MLSDLLTDEDKIEYLVFLAEETVGIIARLIYFI